MEGEPTEAPTELTEPAEDAKDEEKKEYQQKRAIEIAKFKQEQVSKLEGFVQEAEKFKYNATIYTSCNRVDSDSTP
jgi:hypothetical protein